MVRTAVVKVFKFRESFKRESPRADRILEWRVFSDRDYSSPGETARDLENGLPVHRIEKRTGANS